MCFLVNKKSTLSPEGSAQQKAPSAFSQLEEAPKDTCCPQLCTSQSCASIPLPAKKVFPPGHQHTAVGLSSTDGTKGAVQFRWLVVTLGLL